MRNFYFSIAVTVLLFSCTTDSPSLAGSSTILENPAFVGIVLDSSLRPVTNANISVYKIIYSNNSSGTSDTFGIQVFTSHTNGSGEFSFGNVSKGVYIITSNSNDSTSAALLKVTLNNDIDSVIRDTMILSAPGKVKGVVSRNGQQSSSGNNEIKNGDIRIVISEIDRSFITGPNGDFSFSNIPEGDYTLSIYPDDSFFSERKTVNVCAGVVTVLDTIVLNRIPWTAPPKPQMLQITYDTTAESVRLRWNAVRIDNLLGYIVERRLDETILDPVEIVIKDTVFQESVSTFPIGTHVYYSVRSISKQFEKSYAEGPVSIVKK